jgi:hypothetical protein
MDFKAIMRPVQYGKPPGTADVPRPILRRQSSNRRLDVAAVKAERRYPKLGRCPQAVKYHVDQVRQVIAAALDGVQRFARARHHLQHVGGLAEHVQRMAAWTESGTVQRLTLLCSAFFREHNPELFQEVRDTLSAPHRLAAARNHCKVFCFHFATGDKLALEGSANLRTNGNREQFCLIHDAGLHDWHARWIDEEVRKHEGDKSPHTAAR